MKFSDDKRLYDLLYKLADEQKHRPSNEELGNLLGMSVNRIQHALGRLDRDKKIKRKAIGSRFYITIVATGKTTGEKPKAERSYANEKERNAEIAMHKALDRDDLADRIDQDQAKQREARHRWLEIEQEKYKLPRKGKLIDDMIA